MQRSQNSDSLLFSLTVSRLTDIETKVVIANCQVQQFNQLSFERVSNISTTIIAATAADL